MIDESTSGELTKLIQDHNSRMSRIDPLIAPAPKLDEHALIAPTHTAAGQVAHHRYDESTYEALWGALCRHTMRIHVAGTDPAPGFDKIIVNLLDQVRASTYHADDCAVLLTWPSLDIACAAPLVHRGFAPLTVLVARDLREHNDKTPPVAVRRARRGDLDWLTDQAELLHRFEAELGTLPQRPALRDRLYDELADALDNDINLVLVASVGKARVGFVHGQQPHGAWIEQQITAGPVGYLSRLFVAPSARRASVGRSLVHAAQNTFREQGVRVALLHHSLHNPLAAPMWARLGYRSVLTTWTMRLNKHY